MPRRSAWLAAALLLTSCSLPFSDSGPPQYGFIIITDAGEPLVGGSTDVPPTLDLRLHAAAPFRAQDVGVQLDGRPLSLRASGGDLQATVAPLPLASHHHLAISIAGRAQGISIDFSVIAPTGAMAAAHLDPQSGLVVDAVFDDAPDRAELAAALPGASVTWSDPTHARISWSGAAPASLQLPATIATARGSHLAQTLTLALGGLRPGALRRDTVPLPQALPPPPLVAFVVDTAAANTSMAHHEGSLRWVVPTGWTAQPDGSILGTPDEAAVARAAAARLPIWPSLANDPGDPQGTSQLLASSSATSQLIRTVVQSVEDAGFAGVNLDFEGMAATDRDAFTAFAKQLATALHTAGAQLMVDVVPHDLSGVNQFSAAYDLPALGGAADYIDLMAYDEHGDGGSPGPVAGLDWDEELLAATLPGLTPAHTFLGIPLYARVWNSSGGDGASYTDALAQALAVPGARVDYDFAAQTPFITAPDGSLITYFDDADSLARKLALIPEHGLAGAAAWRLGFEDPGFWSLVG